MTQTAAEQEFALGCELELDQDGDWILVPPADVTIFSVPGEGLLIGRCSREQAAIDATEYLTAIVAAGNAAS